MFSPDGSRIAYSAGNPGDEDIFVTNFDQTDTRQVTNLEGAFACTPAWIGDVTDVPGPAASPSPGEPRILERGVLEPGTYLADKSQPKIELTFPAGWHARRNYTDGITFGKIADPFEEELAIARIYVGLTGPCPTDSEVSLGQAPADIVAWLESRSDLETSGKRQINVAGHTGIAIEVSAVDGACSGDEERRHMLYLSGQDAIWLLDGQAMRLIALDVPGRAVTFQLFSTADGLPDFATAAQPILDSVEFPDE